MSNNVKITGNHVLTGKPKEAVIDASGSLVEITHQHSKVHQGVYYTVSKYFSSVASGATALLRVKPGTDNTSHSVVKVACGADAKVEILEGSTYTAVGTSITPRNHNRSSTNTADTSSWHTPTVDADGTVILEELLPGGQGGNSVGSAADIEAEQFVYDADTDYLIRTTNNGSNAEDISIMVSFYEVST